MPTFWEGRRALLYLLAPLVALLMVLPGCDSSQEETIVLSDPLTPTESSFLFSYDENQFSGGVITVTSSETDELSDVLAAYGGYTRDDIVSVRVEEIQLERLSVGGTAAEPAPKVFNYLSRVEVYMGSSTDAPLIGSLEPVPFNAQVALNLGPDRDVTSQVKAGATRALLRLAIEDPNQIGSGGDRVEVTVRFRIEVRN